MKKYSLIALLMGIGINAQFNISVTSDPSFIGKEAYFYTINGSKDNLVGKAERVQNSWKIRYAKPYVGMMKVYFPESNVSLSYISENKDVLFSFATYNQKITSVNYQDASNKVMDEVQGKQRKAEVILPVLYQMKAYYKPDSEFSLAMDREIMNITSEVSVNPSENPFVSYYSKNYNRFLVQNPNSGKPSQQDIIKFISTTDEKLENSSLLRPLLLSYLQNSGKDAPNAVDELIKAVSLESPRGQTVLSELIDIFDAYGMNDLKNKYLSEAQGLKCSINDRLANTIEANKNTEIGAKFPNYTFVSPIHTSAKSLYDVKASKKVIVFWSSTCSHCENELPKLIPHYNALKAKGVEIIGLSLDSDKSSYESKTKNYPWINDSELKGWYSSFAETYNVHATPTYFVLDADNKIISKPDHANDLLTELGIK